MRNIKLLAWIIVPLLVSFMLSYVGYILAGATFGRVKTWSSGEVLTHTDLNAEFDNVINQLDPAGIGPADTTAAGMQATSDPYPGASASVPTSLDGEIQRIRYILAQITGETYWYVDPVNTGVATLGYFSRAQFTWADANTITIGPGVYHHSGTSDQMVYWVSAITFQAGADGSNAGSSGAQADLGDAGWQYLYLDDSAIVTQAAALLDADCFLNSTTAPTYSVTKRGWYNGSDRCLMAMYCDGTNYLEWWHDGGDYIAHASYVLVIDDQALSDSFADAEAAQRGPAFAQRFKTRWLVNEGDQNTVGLYWRMNGSSAATGHLIYVQLDDDDVYPYYAEVYTDTGQLVELKVSVDGTETVDGWTEGWFFPRGM